MSQAIEKIGAGEGNRTLVISLEGIGRSSIYQARSDIWALIGPFERKPLFAAVRTTAFRQPPLDLMAGAIR
jgi:hypothetical protein